MEFTIRRLTASDAALYQPVRLEGLRDHPTAFGAAYEAEQEMPPEAVAQRLARAVTWGAIARGVLVGITTFFVLDGAKTRHKGMIVGVYVRPAARGTGVSRALMQSALDHAKGLVELVQIGVASDDPAARRLYEGLGFVPYGTEPRAYKLADGSYVDDVLMWRAV